MGNWLTARRLRAGVVCAVCIAVGALVESRFETASPPLRETSAADKAVNLVLPEVDLEGIPFSRAIEQIQKQSPVPIIVHWDKLAAAGLDATSPVSFRARNVTLGRVLSELLNAIQGPPIQNVDVTAAYASAGDCILISAAGVIDPRDIVIRSYDVRDLLQPPADPWEVREKPGQLVVYPLAAPQPPPTEEGLEELVMGVIDAKSWQSWGGPGSIGSMRFLAGRLIVLQTWDNQRRVAELLAQLRKPAPPPAPPPATPDLEIWNDALKRYVSTDPGVGEASLRRRIPEVRLDRVPLEQALATLADLAHADLAADWRAFQAFGITRRTPISLHLRDVTLAEALRALLDSNGAAAFHICVDGGCIVLGGLPGYMPESTTTRVYDLRDWLDSVMGQPPTPSPKNLSEAERRAELRFWQMARVIALILETTAPGSWREQGGTAGTMKELNGRLIITQTWENQERVADLLAALRADPSRIQAPPPATFPAAPP
jgi:hypothetical protein